MSRMLTATTWPQCISSQRGDRYPLVVVVVVVDVDVVVVVVGNDGGVVVVVFNDITMVK